MFTKRKKLTFYLCMPHAHPGLGKIRHHLLATGLHTGRSFNAQRRKAVGMVLMRASQQVHANNFCCLQGQATTSTFTGHINYIVRGWWSMRCGGNGVHHPPPKFLNKAFCEFTVHDCILHFCQCNFIVELQTSSWSVSHQIKVGEWQALDKCFWKNEKCLNRTSKVLLSTKNLLLRRKCYGYN